MKPFAIGAARLAALGYFTVTGAFRNRGSPQLARAVTAEISQNINSPGTRWYSVNEVASSALERRFKPAPRNLARGSCFRFFGSEFRQTLVKSAPP